LKNAFILAYLALILIWHSVSKKYSAYWILIFNLNINLITFYNFKPENQMEELTVSAQESLSNVAETANEATQQAQPTENTNELRDKYRFTEEGLW
jgi:hypothetical protein